MSDINSLLPPARLKKEILAAIENRAVPTGSIPATPTERKLLGDAAEAVVGYPNSHVPWTHPTHHPI